MYAHIYIKYVRICIHHMLIYVYIVNFMIPNINDWEETKAVSLALYDS